LSFAPDRAKRARWIGGHPCRSENEPCFVLSRHTGCACPLATSADGIMEYLFEFLFNATGRINRAK
jgi:hypothetical protein